jgi:hypothetical protein
MEISWRNLSERDNLENIDVDGNIIINVVLKYGGMA